MKPFIPYSLLAAFAACGLASAQTAVTTPVGYTTSTIDGAFSPTSPKTSFLAPNLQNVASWTGQVASISGDVLTLKSGASPAALANGAFNELTGFAGLTVYSYFIETADGYWSQISSNDVTSVTVETGAGAEFAVDDVVTIRRHVTIADYFGSNNEAGLVADNDGDPGVADNIIIIDEVNSTSNTIFASNIIGGTWVNDSFEDAAGFPIYPDQGVQIVRRSIDPVDFVFSGEVDVNGRQIEIKSGFQIRPYVLPTDTTLADLDLHTGDPATGLASDGGTADIAEADSVVVITDGNSSTYFYSDLALDATNVGWYDDSFNYVGDTVLPSGSALLIYRNNPTNNSPFIWINPGPVITTP